MKENYNNIYNKKNTDLVVTLFVALNSGNQPAVPLEFGRKYGYGDFVYFLYVLILIK